MTGQDLYEMLGLDKTASQADIKKAYYQLALQWHPDRNAAPEATAKFQALQRIYDVLSDPAKRQLYDRTGSLQECEDMVQGANFQDLFAAFREATKVTEEDLDSFAVQYRGSAEEAADLLGLYRRFRGDMGRVFEWLMLSRPDLDSHRFRATLDAAIQAGEVTATKAYQAWSAKVAASPAPKQDPLAPPPKRSSKQQQQRGGAGDDQALVAAIRSKQSSYNGMLAALEAKYAGKAGSGGSSSSKAKKRGGGAPTPAAAAAGGGGRSEGASAAAAAAAAAACGGGSEKEEELGSFDDQRQSQEPTEEEFAAAAARVAAKQRGKAAGVSSRGVAKQRGGAGKKPKRGQKA